MLFGKPKQPSAVIPEIPTAPQPEEAEAPAGATEAEPHEREGFDLANYKFSQEILAMIPENLARSNLLIPLELQEGRLLVAMADPKDFDAINNIGVYTGMSLKVVYADKDSILESIQTMYTMQRAYDAAKEMLTDDKGEGKVGEGDDSQPIIRFVNNMFEQAIIYKASDIHIEPEEKKLRIRFRVDGHLQNYMEVSPMLAPSIVSRIKFISGLNIAERRIPQDGRINYKGVSKEIDLRISTLPTAFGEKVVIRITTALGFKLNKHSIGFTPENLAKFDKILTLNHGIVLLTGPTGSGKTTTLYSALSEINREDVNIITVEDPVEMIMPGIAQVEINAKAGLTFASALRAILRQDPNIVMVGEIRDKETAQIAMSLSITGHLVFSTLHTYDAPSSIIRLVDMGVEPYMVSASVAAVIAQRLVRKICPNCREEYDSNEEERRLLGIDEAKPRKLTRGRGCDRCNGTGYSGRMAVHEIMFMTNAVKDALAKGATQDQVKEIAKEDGMEPIQDNLKKLVLEGVTTVSEMFEAYSTDL